MRMENREWKIENRVERGNIIWFPRIVSGFLWTCASRA